MGLTYRQTKGSVLTFQELDANFEYFTGSHSVTGSVIVSGSQEIIGSQSITGSQYITGSSIINGTLDVFGTITMISGSSINLVTQSIIGLSTISGSQYITGSQQIIGTNETIGPLIISGSINFGDKGLIQSIPTSSGDGLLASTLELKPDSSLVSDQYIVLDPTTPNHIHIRAGGAIDESTALLYLGGEKANVLVTDSNHQVQINATSVNSSSFSWTFDNNGNTLFPTLTTPRGDINSGDLITNTLKLGDGTNEAVISTPDGTDGYPNSQRLVINPGQGSGSSEGGDIYLWAGRGGVDGGSGGDIKVRGGYGPLTGGGGYIRIEGGDTTDGTAGFVEIKGGNSNTAQGGDVYIYGGQGNGNTQNGNVTINTYDSVGTTKTWTFDTNGTLNTPGNVTVSGSLDVTGNIISTGSLILQPDVSDIRYLEIYNTSAQDTHITASGGWLFLGDDITYIKVDNYSTNNLIELRADNGVAVSGSLNVTGSQVVINTDNFKVRVNDQDGIVIDTTGIYIQDEQGSGAIEASTTNRLLYDSTTGISVDWNNRQLLKSDGTTVAFDWENGILTSSLYGTASWSDNATTASYVENAQTASYVETAQTASYYIAPTASSTPGGTAPEGSFTFVVDGGNCFIYAYINGGWKSGSLV